MTDVIYTESDSNILIESSDGSIDILITESTPNILISEGESLTEITTTTDSITTIESISIGPQGPPGTGEASSDLNVIAATALGGHRIVVFDSNEKVIYADNTILTHAHKVLGMTKGAVVENGNVVVQTKGEMSESSWSWILDTPIWLSTNGLMTQIPPLIGFSLIIGFPISTTKLFLDVREPIFLS